VGENTPEPARSQFMTKSRVGQVPSGEIINESFLPGTLFQDAGGILDEFCK
jgi:hypothetical protein